MLLTSLETAQHLEEADVLHITRQIEACAQIFPEHKSFTMPIGSGVAAITLPSFGRKLNRVVGYGMGGTVSEKDLEIIEDLFAKNEVDTEICLSPLADPSMLQILVERGYSVTRFINSYAKSLTEWDLTEVQGSSVAITRMSAEKTQEFSKLSVDGYKDGGRAELLLETLGRVAALREDTSLYIATVDGKIAGSAAMALIETLKGGVAHLYIDSTLPEYRGQEIQAALLKARLADARKAGFDLASVQAQPGNGSCRNIERAGFGLAYTKIWFAKTRK
jgi:GNAT superfamily N-acetyltransferase